MPENDQWGAAAGAAAGLALAWPTGGLSLLAGPMLGAGLGGTLGGLFGKKKGGPNIDISAELAKINALFEAQKAAARLGITQDAALARSAAASNLAARGTYSAPVSENTFQALDRSKLRAFAESDAAIGAKQAETQASLFAGLLGMQNQNAQIAAQQKAALYGQLGSAGGGLLSAFLTRPAGAAASTMPDSQFNTWQNNYKGGGKTNASPFFNPVYNEKLNNLLVPYGG